MEKYKKKERLFALLPVIILVLTVFFAGSPVKAEQKTHTIWFFFENDSTIVVASVPVMLLYPLVQKHLVKGVMIGAVKG